METGGPTTDAITDGWSTISTAMGTTEGSPLSTTNLSSYLTTAAHMLGVSQEASTAVQNATLHDDLETTMGDLVTKASDVIKGSTTFQPYYEYSTAQFEVLLPCIFGMFVVLALSFIVFYSKHTNQYEVLEKRSGDKTNKTDNTNTQDWSTSNGMGEMNGAFSFGS